CGQSRGPRVSASPAYLDPPTPVTWDDRPSSDVHLPLHRRDCVHPRRRFLRHKQGGEADARHDSPELSPDPPRQRLRGDHEEEGRLLRPSRFRTVPAGDVREALKTAEAAKIDTTTEPVEETFREILRVA